MRKKDMSPKHKMAQDIWLNEKHLNAAYTFPWNCGTGVWSRWKASTENHIHWYWHSDWQSHCNVNRPDRASPNHVLPLKRSVSWRTELMESILRSCNSIFNNQHQQFHHNIQTKPTKSMFPYALERECHVRKNNVRQRQELQSQQWLRTFLMSIKLNLELHQKLVNTMNFD